MTRSIKLSRLDETLETLSYPTNRQSAADDLDDVTLQLANGEEPLGAIVEDVGSDSFDSVDDLRDEIYEYLPEAAIGEPGQSEGDA